MSLRDIDSHKLMYHPDSVSDWKSGVVTPLHAEIGLTNRCNHRCTFCTLDWINHGKTDIETGVIIQAMLDMKRLGVKSVYFAGEGEPTLHKDFDHIVSRAKEIGLDIGLSTNGSKRLKKDTLTKLSWVRFSVDAGTAKTYSKIHGVKEEEFEKVLANIKDSLWIYKEYPRPFPDPMPRLPDVGVQMVLLPENISEINTLYQKVCGVDNFQVKPCHNHPKSSYTPSLFEFSHEEIKKRLESYQTYQAGNREDCPHIIVRSLSMERLHEPRNYEQCHAFDFYILIDCNGNVVPCNIFYDEPDFIFGNINEESVEDIIFGLRRRKIIEKIAETNHCKCGEYRCRLDVMNRYLERVKNPEKNDTFI